MNANVILSSAQRVIRARALQSTSSVRGIVGPDILKKVALAEIALWASQQDESISSERVREELDAAVRWVHSPDFGSLTS